MAASKENILTRYFFVVVLMTLIGVGIVVKAGVTMFVERQYWHDVADRFVRDSVVVHAMRGNILSADGQVMASSLPQYAIFLDYGANGGKVDSLIRENIDSICIGLNRIIPSMSVKDFRRTLLSGKTARHNRHYRIYPGRISYIQYQEVKQLPVFRLSPGVGGFHTEEYNRREKPFGSLAARTLGDVYADASLGAKNGIELAYDSLLRGRDGMIHRQKVKNRYLSIEDVPPVDGCDILTTIDVRMQDICEQALVEKLEELGNAITGVAILMEVKTGDVKAIVNMERGSDGKFYEIQNHAISDMLEPGSTFKTASIMVALEDGYITPETEFDTGNGIRDMYGSKMKDHNWHRGGYGKINVTRILEVSSNVGVSGLIDRYYKNNPQKFVDGLKRMSLDQPLHLDIPGEGKPNVKGPSERYFAKTTLPWMSIGYETQLPPINTLTFYNAIANDGVMVRPRFVTAAMKDGEVVEAYPVQVINPQICSDKTLGEIREILRKVVSEGLAKPARCEEFSVSGKTGTAQVSQGAAGYKAGRTGYLVSFCGYFPSEAPKYSCIVAIRKSGLPASGGLMAGSVFGRIAERVYAQDLHYDMAHAVDSTTNHVPTVKNGHVRESLYVLNKLDIGVDKSSVPGNTDNLWAGMRSDTVQVKPEPYEPTDNKVPRVVGMGAKDAVYLLEQHGLRVRLSGIGRVRSQSIAAGTTVRRGATVSLRLSN